MNRFVSHFPTKLIFGSGSLHELSNQALPGKNALLLVSDGKSAKENRSLEQVIDQLTDRNVAYKVFDKIMENPVKSMVMEAATFAKENHCDFIIAIGGGAVLDASKAIAAMATNSGDLWDYVRGGTGKGKALLSQGLPIVAIATTSGTGSEINAYGVISNPDTNEKIGFGAPELTPVLAIVDPDLMRTVAKDYTAYQGFDALFHNTEVMISKKINLLSETLALSAIENIASYLPRAVQDGMDQEARERVAYASTLAGMTMFLTSTTAAHAMEHSMSGYHRNLPHGAGLIMIAKAFYQFFIDKHVCDAQFVKMAKAMGIADADKPQDFITALMKLQGDCGVDHLKMSDYGLEKTEFMTLAKGARSMQGGLFLANPYEMSDADCAAIFEKSYR